MGRRFESCRAHQSLRSFGYAQDFGTRLRRRVNASSSNPAALTTRVLIDATVDLGRREILRA
jgi:hypothetical protein